MTIKPPPLKTAVYALAALLSLAASYLAVRHIAALPGTGVENKQTPGAARFFADDGAAKRGDARDMAAEEPKKAAADARKPAKSTELPVATEITPAGGQDTAKASGVPAPDADNGNVTATTTATESTDTSAISVRVKTAPPPAPPATEGAMIKSATEAMAKKEWDRAVRILERNSAVFTEKRTERVLLLLEAYVESRQLDKARLLIEGAAQINDAQYFLTAGRYWLYRGDHAKALEALEASLTRSSLARSRSAVFGDAMYYIALVRSERYKTTPTDANRTLAANAWKRVKAAHEQSPANPRFKRAETEIAALN